MIEEGQLAPVEAGHPVPLDVRSEITNMSYPYAKFESVYTNFMQNDTDLPACAKEAGLPLIVVLEWSKKYRWAARKAELYADAVRSLETQERLTRATARKLVIMRQLEEARQIAEKANEFAKDANGTRDLKAAAEAYKAAADVESRAAGIAEKTVERGTDSTGEAKVPSFWLGIQANKVDITEHTS